MRRVANADQKGQRGVTQTDYGFHPVWVQPFYLELMQANLLSLDPAARAALADRLRQALRAIDTDTLTAMLADSNWRPRIVAGWFIGFQRRAELLDAVHAELRRRPYYAQHCCFALARIGTLAAMDVLEQYLDTHLRHATFDPDTERLSIDWALAALAWLDRAQQAQRSRPWLVAGGPWDTLVSEGLDRMPELRNRPAGAAWRAAWQQRWDLHRAREQVAGAMRFAAEVSDG